MMNIWQNIKDWWVDFQPLTSLRDRLSGDKKLLKSIGIGIVLVIGLYYPIGMMIVHKVDDNLGYTPILNPGESEAVANAAGLMRREIEDYRWTAMDPFFMPGAALDNMPNFQKGMVSAISRFAIEMSDQIGRVRGSSQVDEDLDKAAGLFKYKPDVWVYDISESWLPQRSSAQQYMLAVRSFENYNRRLAAGEAIFERRGDNLLATIDRITADLGSASAVIDSTIQDLSAFSFDTDDVFYRTKGRLYAYYFILKGLKTDYANVIEERKLTKAWDQMLLSLQEAASMDPLLVTNAAPDSFIMPSHLAGQGFYLLRARTQLREISNVLLK
ncbi:DUF2333 family protein [Curvivirga sp.]|uniref:DUF2333 family protein n=1 Tax=Curvivirga sp. TaxID=2856848 RepID=UPI003B5AAA20